jgi:hypothetical protein
MLDGLLTLQPVVIYQELQIFVFQRILQKLLFHACNLRCRCFFRPLEFGKVHKILRHHPICLINLE